MTNWDDAILVGVVARTHGNKGEVAVNAETDFPEERFKQGARLWSRAKDGSLDTLEVATMRMHQGRPLILFKGIGSMSDAELLAGRELRIAEAEGDADLLDHRIEGHALRALVLRQPRVELALDLLELEGDHEEDAQAEDDVHQRRHVDRDRVLF